MTTTFKVGDVVKVRAGKTCYIVLRVENVVGHQLLTLNNGARYHAASFELVPRESKDEFSDLDLTLDI